MTIVLGYIIRTVFIKEDEVNRSSMLSPKLLSLLCNFGLHRFIRLFQAQQNQASSLAILYPAAASTVLAWLPPIPLRWLRLKRWPDLRCPIVGSIEARRFSHFLCGPCSTLGYPAYDLNTHLTAFIFLNTVSSITLITIDILHTLVSQRFDLIQRLSSVWPS